MDIIKRPSPNYDSRPDGQVIDLVVLHYTGMKSGPMALERLCDPAAKVSAHFLVEDDGRVFQLVEEKARAWHAGVSSWHGQAQTNSRSIGIEIVNPGHEWGYVDFPPAQIEAVCALLEDIMKRHHVRAHQVVGHSDVAPGRKEDPGEKFPWDRLAMKGLSIGTFQGGYDAMGEDALSYGEALSTLGDIGYDVAQGNHAAAVLAFQRRFCPSALGQGVSPMTKAAIEWAKRKMAG